MSLKLQLNLKIMWLCPFNIKTIAAFHNDHPIIFVCLAFVTEINPGLNNPRTNVVQCNYLSVRAKGELG